MKIDNFGYPTSILQLGKVGRLMYDNRFVRTKVDHIVLSYVLNETEFPQDGLLILYYK